VCRQRETTYRSRRLVPASAALALLYRARSVARPSGSFLGSTQTCTPGALTCEGDKLKTCNSLGTGVEGDGTDCTATNKVCYAGACRNVVCTDTRICVSGNVHSCNNRGTETALYTTCSSPNVCLPNSGYASCAPPICTPGSKGCSGNAVATCNAEGSGYLPGGTPCATNAACVNGTCLPVVCTASALFCNQGNVYSCGAQGVSSTLYSTCAASQHCYAQGSNVYCRSDVCTGGAPTCRDAFATTCAADGSGPLPTGGTNCAATGLGCDAGACKPIVCDKGETFCKNGAIEQCNASGTGSSLYTTCETSSYCKDVGTSAACWGDICVASTPACDGEKPAVCDATGGGFVPGATNCATTRQVCNQSAVCSATAVDSIGSESLMSSAAGGYLNVLEVRTARVLTQIEQHVAINGTAVLTWVVYERDAANTLALFTKIFERTAAASGAGTGAFVSSGAIDVALSPTKIYAVGVIVGSSHSQSLIYSSALMPLSFGRFMSGGRISGTTAPATPSGFYASTLPMQKLTTKLP
jgi:hypothetical protein